MRNWKNVQVKYYLKIKTNSFTFNTEKMKPMIFNWPLNEIIVMTIKHIYPQRLITVLFVHFFL